MGTNVKDINLPLSPDILKGPAHSLKASHSFIERFIKQQVPVHDTKAIKNDLKWQFMLEQQSLVKMRGRKPKKSFLTRKQRKETKLLKLPKEGWDYESLASVRNMWKDYMRQNLEHVTKAPTCTDQDWQNFSVIVSKSELIGAELTVVKSKVPSLVGLSGTIVLETKLTFQIVTSQSKLKTILKDTSLFQIQLDSIKFTFFGKHLATRPSERSSRKIKLQMVPDL